MPCRYRFFAAAVLFASLFGCGLLLPPHAANAQDVKTITGTVKELDLEKGTIKLQLYGRDETCNLASKDIKVVSTTGQMGKVADIQLGAKVVLHQTDADVVSIQVEAATRWGVVSAVDGKANTFSVRSGEVEAPATKLTVSPDAKVLVEGKPGKFADVKAGQRVRATLTIDGKGAVIVNAADKLETIRTAENLKPRAAVRLTGVLLDLDRDQRRVQVLIEYPTPLTLTWFDVEADVHVKLKYMGTVVHESLAFKDLGKLLHVAVLLDADTRTVTAIDAEYPVFTRRVVDFDLDKGTLTVSEETKERTLPLAKDARLFAAGKEVKLNRLSKGKAAIVGLSVDRSKVEVLFVTEVEKEEK